MINYNKTDLVKCAYIVDKIRLMQMSMELHGWNADARKFSLTNIVVFVLCDLRIYGYWILWVAIIYAEVQFDFYRFDCAICIVNCIIFCLFCTLWIPWNLYSPIVL